jgi:Protein of unknown function (DUF3667)
MGNFEAVGDAVTGGMLGRAVEPKAGETSDGHTHETNCLNCGAPLAGPYCHECGQHAHVHRTLSAFFHDFLHGVLHFEGKIWRTLPLLVWRPGELTRGYIDGQRARFVSPVALFLFFVFLTFAAISFGSMFGGPNAGVVKAQLAEQVNDAKRDIAKLEMKRSIAAKAGAPTAGLEEELKDARSELATLTSFETHGNKSAAEIPKGVLPWIRQPLKKATDNPELLLYKIKTNAYKFSWALIPISALFVWMLFPFSRKFRMYDHIVFVTYSLCFMMLLFTASTLVGLISASIASLAFFVPPFHMYRQLKGTYALSRGGALWRTAALTIFAFMAISLFVSLLVGLGLFD